MNTLTVILKSFVAREYIEPTTVQIYNDCISVAETVDIKSNQAWIIATLESGYVKFSLDSVVSYSLILNPVKASIPSQESSDNHLNPYSPLPVKKKRK